MHPAVHCCRNLVFRHSPRFLLDGSRAWMRRVASIVLSSTFASGVIVFLTAFQLLLRTYYYNRATNQSSWTIPTA